MVKRNIAIALIAFIGLSFTFFGGLTIDFLSNQSETGAYKYFTPKQGANDTIGTVQRIKDTASAIRTFVGTPVTVNTSSKVFHLATATITGDGAATSFAVTHGAGFTPTVVIVGSSTTRGLGVTSIGATTFTVTLSGTALGNGVQATIFYLCK